MEPINIFRTSISGIYGVETQFPTISKFLLENRSDIRIQEEDKTEILKTKVLSTTPISRIFDNMLSTRKEHIFALLNIPSGVSTPELFTMNHILVDVKQLEDVDSRNYRTISTFPEYKDKLIVNLTPFLKKKIQNAVTDMGAIQELLVKGLLVRSYYDSKNWLTPALIKYLSKSYSMTISSNIARIYNLNYNEQMTVATILTAYFQLLCFSDRTKNEFPVSIKDCSYLGNRIDIVERLENIKEKLDGDVESFDVNKMCEVISQLGPDRMSKFNTRVFYTSNQRLGNDHVSTLMSLEYPPYWAHQVLLALSGVKSGLYMAMKKQGKLVREGKDFSDTLARTSSFLDSIEDR